MDVGVERNDRECEKRKSEREESGSLERKANNNEESDERVQSVFDEIEEIGENG